MRSGSQRVQALLLAILLLASCALGQSPAPKEYQLKAAFVYHFAQFVEWPVQAFKDSSTPFVVGVLGENPFGGELEKTLGGKSVNDRPLLVRGLNSVADATNGCQMVFVSASEKKQLPEILKALQGVSVLTVGETDGFIEAGGMINFIREGAKIRFQINDAAAKRANLKISSKLLSLASRPGR